MLKNLEKYKVILASNSPRRKELLSGLGICYEVKTLPGIEESYPDTLSGEEIPVFIACEKADAYRQTMHSDELIITADTIVWLDGLVMGKPEDEEDARRMLRCLSGKTHQVITGVCLTTTEFQKSFATVTDVTFAELTEEEIDYYVYSIQNNKINDEVYNSSIRTMTSEYKKIKENKKHAPKQPYTPYMR